jgi:hypothetical protein
MQNKKNQVNLRPGNSKMGKVLHVNLPPCKTCSPHLPCHRVSQCYAMKAWVQYPETKKSWMYNWNFWDKNPTGFFDSIGVQIMKKRKVDIFRWHSAGDIPDLDYLKRMYTMAHWFPGIKFMAFTKKYQLILDNVDRRHSFWKAPNMTLVVSAWPGLRMPPAIKRKFPIAWMEGPDNLDKRIPDDARECSGRCDECLKCWNLKKGESVFFHKH